MPLRLATTAMDDACNAIVDRIDLDAGAGVIKIYQGTQPANPQTAHGSTELAIITFAATAFGASSAGVASVGAITPDTSVTGGTAQWARILSGDAADPADAVMDMDIGQGSGTLDFDNVTFIAGGTADIDTMTVTVPMT